MRLGVLVLLAAALGGCAGSVRLPPPGAPRVAVHEDVSQRYVEIVGPRQQHAPPFLGVHDTNYFLLRSWLDRTTGAAHHQLYVSDSYLGPVRQWEAATAADGTALRFVAVSHDKIACAPQCSWTEDFTAAIPDAMLRTRREGLAVSFLAHSGDRLKIDLSRSQIDQQLAAVAWERHRLLTNRGSPDQPAPARTQTMTQREVQAPGKPGRAAE